jgi:phospholipase C
VSSSLADQTSITAFIEDNWLGGERTGTSSFDNIAGSLDDMFNFKQPSAAKLVLNAKTGEALH